MIELKPLDVVVVNGLWYMPHHWLIRWRGLDSGVHCVTIAYNGGKNAISPEFTGMRFRDMDHYKGRRVTIHRYKGKLPLGIKGWLGLTFATSKGYDFRQWIFGFVLGLTRKKWADNSQQWTCAELPYWAFQENGEMITPKDEVLPMPRLFRYNPLFETIFDGVWE